MGNRAVITTEENFNNGGIGIYLHWNGGRDSVEAFLAYAKLKKFESGSYGFARLCQVIGNFFGGELDIGINTVDHLDCENYDNGVYLIDDKFNIVGRRYFEGTEQNDHDLVTMLKAINNAQPENGRIREQLLIAYAEKVMEEK